MSIAISASLAVPSPVPSEASNLASNAASNPASNEKAAPKDQPVFVPPDHVNLTEPQQVYQLYNQGQRVSQIASDLNLSVAAVNSYLNISNSTG